MKRVRRTLPIFVCLVSGVLPAAAVTPEVLPEACEVGLALAAAPEHLRDGATVYAFRDEGYEKVRGGDNGFTCLVNRDEPRVLKPTCFDAEGSRTIVPKILQVGKMLAEGFDADEIHRRIARGFEEGTFESPKRSGVAYMLSHYNRPWNPQTRRLGWFPPHVMFYAPGVAGTDIGFDPSTFQTDIHYPFVGYQGPHGYFIVRTEPESRPWAHPQPACPAWVMGRHGELPLESRQFDFWHGTWDVDMKIRQDDGSWPSRIAAEARIYSVLGGKAVLELWDSQPIKGYSLRYYDPGAGKWVLWLNWPRKNRSVGSELTGGFENGRGDFYSTRRGEDGAEVISRYSFNDITPESLRWDDGFSEDGGETWRSNWIMRFDRTAPAASLDPAGGDEHTWETGERCDEPQFRRFEVLAGRREGTLELGEPGGRTATVPAELVSYRILDGCAVMALLRSTDEDAVWESLHLLTWNGTEGRFEESVLDRRPDSALRILRGDSSSGTVELEGSPRRVEEITHRHRWTLDGPIRLEVDRAESGELRRVLTARFAEDA